MNNNLETQKSIELRKLREKFSILARSPPAYNPFTSENRYAWDEWAESCREMEGALREAGEVL